MASVADPEEPVALETLLSERHFEEKQVAERPSWRSLAAVVVGRRPDGDLAPDAAARSGDGGSRHRLGQAFGEQWWAPWLLMASYTPACLVMFPRPLITLAAVIAFGPVWGFFQPGRHLLARPVT